MARGSPKFTTALPPAVGEWWLEGLARAYLAEIKILAGAPAEAEAQARRARAFLASTGAVPAG